jgi:uncharacterized membrane protein (UPF0136 family)
MRRPTTTLSIDAGDRLELLMVSAAVTVLCIRFFLAATGYPQIGGDGLHIAHLLWGGLAMLVAIVLAIGWLGRQTLSAAALIGGIGFGFFIDEIGKFVTSDNDYFFAPAIALIYLIFVILALVLRGVRSRLQRPVAAVPNALALMADASVEGLDRPTRDHILQLLDGAPADLRVASELRALVARLPVLEERELGPYQRLRGALARRYAAICGTRWFERAVIAGAVVYVLLGIPDVTEAIFSGSPEGLLHDILDTDLAAFASAIVFLLLSFGVWRVVRGRRVAGFRTMRLSVLISILVLHPLEFWDNQLAALPSLVLSLLLYGALRYMIFREEELEAERGERRAEGVPAAV